MAPLVAARNIKKAFDRIPVLHGIDLDLMPGEIIGLLGENGAGKSTLMNILSGELQADSGEIAFDGAPVRLEGTRGRDLGIRFIHQELSIVPSLSVAENIFLGDYCAGPSGFIDRKAMRTSSEAELDRLGVRTAPMTRPVEMLSGGQRQVVALARSAIRVNSEGGVLLLDEPTAALGYEQTKQVEALIRRMAEQGIAIVLVTHDLPLCYEVADRLIILNRGRKVADVPGTGVDHDHVVGWITGSRASQFAS